jgi:hypothetical protein
MTKTKYKRIIDQFIEAKYEYLIECSTNILKNKQGDPYDLTAELVLFLYDKQEKIDIFISQDSYMDYDSEQMLQGFSVSWLRIQGAHATSPFGRRWAINDKELQNISEPADETGEYAEGEEDEYVKDLKRVYTDEQITKILRIHDIYPTLSNVEQMLFRAYFLEGLSYEKIRNKYTFYRTDKVGKTIYYKSKKSIYNLMTELKKEIQSKL